MRRLVFAAALIGVLPCVAQNSPSSSAPAATSASGSNGTRSSETGSIRGRVVNPVSGAYLENARVTIVGTTMETLTDSAGEYRFANVPVGRVEVKAFYSGREEETAVVAVEPGETARQDFSLTFFDTPRTVKLPEFVVATTREMEGAAIAINEQRFAPNIKHVVDANEFGPMGEGGIGEVLQFMPGISVNTLVGSVYDIQLNGVPSDFVPVRLNGFDLASARETTSRTTVLQAAPTTHSVSRIEVLHSPTPESPGGALAGSINLVPKSAFERSRPQLNFRAYMLFRDGEWDLGKSPGATRDDTRKAHPGFNFSYVNPVNDRFGFTLSGGASKQYLRTDTVSNAWRGASAATNGNAYPHTTPDQPYLSQYSIGLFNTNSTRRSLGATIDYKLGPNDRLSLGVQYVKNTQEIYGPSRQFNTGRIANFTSDSTQGAPGAGNMVTSASSRTVVDPGFTYTLTYRHNGPVWDVDAGAGDSRSTNSVENFSRGTFFNAIARRTNVTVGFDDFTAFRPGSITVTERDGTPVDPFSLDSFNFAQGNGHTLDLVGSNGVRALQQSAFVNAGRSFDARVPFSIKTGLDIRRNMRDLTNGGQTQYIYVGPDGVPDSGDENAGFLLDEVNSEQIPAHGFRAFEFLSPWEAYDTAVAHPDHFTINRVSEYTSAATRSKRAEEIISSAYLRGDVSLIDGRLKLIGGIRAEQTNVDAEGPLNDATLNYQRDASGNILLSPTGNPIPITTDPLEAAQLTIISRGMRAKKEYLRLFPSLNASFNIRDNLIARAAVYESVGRPNFNQYAGGITLPNTEAENQSNQRITVNNAGIKAWSARSFKVSLEYYFQKVGLISIGAFRRDFENFFGNVEFPATPEFLDLYGIDPTIYGHYPVRTQHNIESGVRMQGFDINYKQALTFLPEWARGVQVFANASVLRATGPETANFAGFVPRTYSWGVSLSRPRFDIKASWNYRGRNRLTQITGNGIEPGTFRWRNSLLSYVLTAEYRLTPRYALFVSVNNAVVGNVEIEGPNTPDYARILSSRVYGGLWTIGVSGKF